MPPGETSPPPAQIKHISVMQRKVFHGCSPEEEHEGAQEAAEVVVPVNVAFLI